MIWVLLSLCSLFALFFIINCIKKRNFVSQFSKGNVMLGGLRGRGKDLAFCIVVNSRKRNYISNVQYSKPKAKFQRFEFDSKVWELSGNTYTDMIDGKTKTYVYPYPDNIDYYISDAGIYFPAQYANELCRRYKSAPMFQALSRQLGNCNVHTNSQAINRVWDKIREQSELYIIMTGAHKIPKTKIFLVTAYQYERLETAQNGIKPPKFGLGKEAKQAKFNFEIQHGKIKRHWFFTRLPYAYDSRRFKRILENNCKDYENDQEN